MCMEDIRLGRKTAGIQNLIALTNASQRIVDQSPDRVMLTIYPPVSGTATIAMSADVAVNVGITLTSEDHPIKLNIIDDGDLVTKAWYGIHSAGGVTLAIYEGRLSER